MARLLRFLLCRRKKRGMIFLFLTLFFIFILRNPSHSGSHSTCVAPKQNLLYIKMIKCASTTLSSVFRRYAYQRNLSVVLPVDNKILLGWPYKMDYESFRPTKTGSFNFLVDHSVFDEQFMGNLMPADTVYVTSIRKPYQQFKSMFNFYKVAENSNMTPANRETQVSEYLQHLEKYEAVYKSHEMAKTRYCIPDDFSMTKNLMAFNLGFPAGKPDGTLDASNDEEFIEYFLDSIESKFKLVMIVEYFDESMVLLRRIMCWDIKDVLYSKKNIGDYSKDAHKKISKARNKMEQRNIEIYRKWSAVDYKLYEHFRMVFWRKIRDEGADFYKELRYYKKVNKIINDFCHSIETGTVEPFKKLTVAKTPYSDNIVVDQAFCKLLGTRLELELKKYYDDLPGPVNKVVPSKFFC